MRLLRFASPSRAFRDLRAFLTARKRYELLMLVPALLITCTIVYLFYLDYRFEKPYERHIVYVQSWPLSRTDAEIRAQQKIDQESSKKMRVELKVLQKQRQGEFKRVDDWLTRHGI